jgi:hypothetical protein
MAKEQALKRLRTPPTRRRPALLAAGAAVLISLVLGVYAGWRQAPSPAAPAAEAIAGDPLPLKLDAQLRSYRR